MIKKISFATFCICLVILTHVLYAACKDDKPGKQNPIPSLKEEEVLLNTKEVKRQQDRPKTIKLKIRTKRRKFRSDNFTREQRRDIEEYLESMSVQEIELNLGANQPRYEPFHVQYIKELEIGAMTSCWELTDEEINQLIKSKRIHVSQLTF